MCAVGGQACTSNHTRLRLVRRVRCGGSGATSAQVTLSGEMERSRLKGSLQATSLPA